MHARKRLTSCVFLYLFLKHQQCLALFNRIKFTRLLLTALIAFTKKEVRRKQRDVHIRKTAIYNSETLRLEH